MFVPFCGKIDMFPLLAGYENGIGSLNMGYALPYRSNVPLHKSLQNERFLGGISFRKPEPCHAIPRQTGISCCQNGRRQSAAPFDNSNLRQFGHFCLDMRDDMRSLKQLHPSLFAGTALKTFWICKPNRMFALGGISPVSRAFDGISSDGEILDAERAGIHGKFGARCL